MVVFQESIKIRGKFLRFPNEWVKASYERMWLAHKRHFLCFKADVWKCGLTEFKAGLLDPTKPYHPKAFSHQWSLSSKDSSPCFTVNQGELSQRFWDPSALSWKARRCPSSCETQSLRFGIWGWGPKRAQLGLQYRGCNGGAGQRAGVESKGWIWAFPLRLCGLWQVTFLSIHFFICRLGTVPPALANAWRCLRRACLWKCPENRKDSHHIWRLLTSPALSPTTPPLCSVFQPGKPSFGFFIGSFLLPLGLCTCCFHDLKCSSHLWFDFSPIHPRTQLIATPSPISFGWNPLLQVYIHSITIL